jgi:hypothetical protein
LLYYINNIVRVYREEGGLFHQGFPRGLVPYGKYVFLGVAVLAVSAGEGGPLVAASEGGGGATLSLCCGLGGGAYKESADGGTLGLEPKGEYDDLTGEAEPVAPMRSV